MIIDYSGPLLLHKKNIENREKSKVFFDKFREFDMGKIRKAKSFKAFLIIQIGFSAFSLKNLFTNGIRV